ncbi:MAG TPA: hypothetical protein DCE23_08505, partial [Firmicutes bacterium]|nr:hypothetical protein [Bacillota bacterium]
MAKILIADDEQAIAELMSDVLVDEGFETVIKNDGYSVIEAVKNDSFDLILL